VSLSPECGGIVALIRTGLKNLGTEGKCPLPFETQGKRKGAAATTRGEKTLPWRERRPASL